MICKGCDVQDRLNAVAASDGSDSQGPVSQGADSCGPDRRPDSEPAEPNPPNQPATEPSSALSGRQFALDGDI